MRMRAGKKKLTSLLLCMMLIVAMALCTTGCNENKNQESQQSSETIQSQGGVLGEGKTVIMIAHRLSTVVNADKIFVIEDGKVKESGKHSELVAENGVYNRMWKEYQSAADWKVGANK